MNTTTPKPPYPDHTPPTPPEGMKWDYRGLGWMTEKPVTFYVIHQANAAHVGDAGTTGNYRAGGNPKRHYFEAVPILKDSGFEFGKTTLKDVLTSENLKEAEGRKKCPMQLLSPSAMRETANALGHGAQKYQPRNYRKAGINATTYVGAILRHISAWNDGEDNDPESGLSHIAHVSACCDILLDCAATGMLNDDRSKKP